MVIPKHHLGAGFKVWTRQRTWFWFVASPYGNGGTIGTAATEAEAIRSASALVEAVSGARRAPARRKR